MLQPKEREKTLLYQKLIKLMADQSQIKSFPKKKKKYQK